MTLETERLVLRPWEEADAENLFEYAKDPEVGPPAGWRPHSSIEESRRIIKNVLNGKEAYAVCLKSDGKPIGAIELMLSEKKADECELGYWIAKPFWGQGLIPEAGRELLRRAFEDLGMNIVWCKYYDFNVKSKRVQEKLGFRYHHKVLNAEVPALGERRTDIVNIMKREDWLSLYGSND